jgi:hypothetical protein
MTDKEIAEKVAERSQMNKPLSDEELETLKEELSVYVEQVVLKRKEFDSLIATIDSLNVKRFSAERKVDELQEALVKAGYYMVKLR